MVAVLLLCVACQENEGPSKTSQIVRKKAANEQAVARHDIPLPDASAVHLTLLPNHHHRTDKQRDQLQAQAKLLLLSFLPFVPFCRSNASASLHHRLQACLAHVLTRAPLIMFGRRKKDTEGGGGNKGRNSEDELLKVSKAEKERAAREEGE